MVTMWRSGRRGATETHSIELRLYTKLNKGDAIQFYSVLGKEMKSKSDSLNSFVISCQDKAILYNSQQNESGLIHAIMYTTSEQIIELESPDCSGFKVM